MAWELNKVAYVECSKNHDPPDKLENFSIVILGGHAPQTLEHYHKRINCCSIRCAPDCYRCRQKKILYYQCCNCDQLMCMECMNLRLNMVDIEFWPPWFQTNLDTEQHFFCFDCEKRLRINKHRKDLARKVFSQVLLVDLGEIIVKYMDE